MVAAGSTTDPTAEIIEFWDNSKIDHYMFSILEGTFTWQSMQNWYGTRPMDAYLKKGGILKFYRVINATPEFKNAIIKYNQDRINLPWYKHLYNWLGIVGQATGIHAISFPGLFFCSQVVINGMKKCAEFLTPEQCSAVIKMDDNMNPAALDDYMLAFNQVWELAYTWDSKTGIIA